MPVTVKAICANTLFSCKILKRSRVLGIFSHMMVTRLSNTARIAFLAGFLCFTVAGTALAGIAASPCDPEYYNSLKSRAWLEAQREITQNQNIIVKPDSVLEYMCFDGFLNVMANMNAPGANTLFSESTRWPAPGQLGSTSMDTALTRLISNALGQYISGNFAHNFLGDRSTRNHTPAGSVSGSAGTSFVCNNMRDIWAEAKCMDFIPDTNADGVPDFGDGFYTFEDYRAAPDKRARPTATPCATASLFGGTGRWTTEFNRATTNADTTWAEDNLRVFFDLLDPANCTTALQVATGVTVVRAQNTPATYREKICVAPGCHYTPTAINAGTCSR